MRSLFKRSLLIIPALVIVIAVGAGLAYVLALRSVPPTGGKMGLVGLSQPASITRDENGVPHIKAANLRDALMALGFVHAQDRLWQMELLRRTGQGRLSEFFGKPTLKTDEFIRTLGFSGHARRSFVRLPDDIKDLFEAYAAGVNQWVQRKPDFLAPKLPPEFQLTRTRPETWQAYNGLEIMKVMDLSLAKNLTDEMQRLALVSEGMSPAEIEDFMPPPDGNRADPLPDLRPIYGYTEKGKVKTREGNQGGKQSGLVIPIGRFASNNWVIAGDRTQSEMPLLANDPHLGLSTPGLFYLVHLQYEEDGETKNLVGASLPGVPTVMLGRNDHIAWGFTNTGLDNQDLFLEQINPEDKDEYLTPKGYEPFDTEKVTIKVAGEEDYTFTRRLTRHGPVLPSYFRGLSGILPEGTVGALQWTSLDDRDKTAVGLMSMMKAKTVYQFMDGLAPVVSPMQSIVVADKQGNIALIAPGMVPVRKDANRIKGRAPVPGWNAEYDWKGVLDFSELPRIVNPPQGALGTANGNWLPENYPYMITRDWEENFRQKRLRELVLDNPEPHSMVSMARAMGDTYSIALVKFRDQALLAIPEGLGPQPGMMQAIRQWDGNMDAESPIPLVLASWFRHSHELIFKDDLGDAWRYFSNPRISSLLAVMEAQRSRAWCDDLKTDAEEDCKYMLDKALGLANKELIGLQGADWRKWKWGKAHLAYNEHLPFSSVGSLKNYFTLSPQSSGGSYTLRRGKWDFSETDHPYWARMASVYRAIYDFSDFDNSRYMITTGQSGHVLSPHYDDLAKPWANMDFIQISSKIPEEKFAPGAKLPENVWYLSVREKPAETVDDDKTKEANKADMRHQPVNEEPAIIYED